MGFFGGDNDNEPSHAEQLMERQYQENQQELELKKANLYKAKLGIIKSQGGESWTPDYSSPNSARSGRSGMGGLPMGVGVPFGMPGMGFIGKQ